MQQSNVIFANLFIAYFLFVTAKGELPSYIDLLRGGGTPPSPAGNGIISVSGSGPLGSLAASSINSAINANLPNNMGSGGPFADTPDYLTMLTNGGETDASLNALPDTGE